LLVVVVVFSFEMVVPSGRVTLPLTVVCELVVVSVEAGGVFTTVVEDEAGGGVVVLGTTTVVVFSVLAVVAGAGVVVEVVVVRSHAARAKAPSCSAAVAWIGLFMAIAPVIVGIQH
jgi:hypothetical protein